MSGSAEHRVQRWLGELDNQAQRRRRDGLWRELRPRHQHRESMLDLASNDYLGLARHPWVVAAAAEAAHAWGAGATGSRLVTGHTTLHEELESELAGFTGAPAALVFSSGYLANLGALGALCTPETAVISDAGNHASLIDACRLAPGTVTVVPRNDPEAVVTRLRSTAENPQPPIVVVESISSIDGEPAPLTRLHEACRQWGALLVVDEAHALGVCGPCGSGLVAAQGLAAAPEVVRTVTLSKALGSQGGAVLAAESIVQRLINHARGFIFDTGLAPPSAAAALAAIRVLRAQPGLPGRTLRVAAALADMLGVARPPSAVVSLILGEPDRAVAAATGLAAGGVHAGCFRPPSVPEGTSRIRMTARADISDEQLQHVSGVVHDLGLGQW